MPSVIPPNVTTSSMNNGKACYLVSFTVYGNGQFPFDMLRYDSCFPVSTDDAKKLIGDDSMLEIRHVRLGTVAGYKQWSPTVGRWLSFGWKVET